VLIDYVYNAPAAGSSSTLSNPIAGTTNYFAAKLAMKRVNNGVAQTLYLGLNRCLSTKLALATKIEDFLIPEFDFLAVADASGTIGQWTSAE
jgi:hypothetical protein